MPMFPVFMHFHNITLSIENIWLDKGYASLEPPWWENRILLVRLTFQISRWGPTNIYTVTSDVVDAEVNYRKTS